MHLLSSILQSARFEMGQGMTIRRMAVAGVLALFPPVMLFLVLIVNNNSVFPVNMIICIFVFIVGQLSLLLWATPNVYSELESRGWIYLTARTHGRIGLLFGKYLAAVIYSWLMCIAAMTICLIVVDTLVTLEKPWIRTWPAFAGLITFATLAYGAIYSLFGVIFQKRAMVIAVVYAFVSDMLVANIPALISKLTLRHYVHGIALDWLGIDLDIPDLPPTIESYLTYPAELPTWLHILSLLLITSFALGLAAFIIRYREYVTSNET